MPKSQKLRRIAMRLPVDTGWLEQLRREARNKVREFLWAKSFGDKKLAEKCTKLLHGPICLFAASQSQRKIHRKAGRIIYQQVPATNAAILSLRRLERHSKKGGYHWAKAWAELTPVARKAILAALPPDSPLPIGAAPDPSVIIRHIAAAMERARLPQTTTLERDKAVIGILRAYIKVYQKKPPSPTGPRSKTILFITGIENAYRDLLPNGFGVSRSKATLDRLIKRAWPLNP